MPTDPLPLDPSAALSALVLAAAAAAGLLGLAVLVQVPAMTVMWWLRGRSGRNEREVQVGAPSETPSVPGTKPVRLRRAAGQLLGAREIQEDDFGFIDGATLEPGGQHPVVVVADGMGGHASGEMASRLAVRAFVEAYGTEGRPSDRLRAGLDHANRAIDDAVRKNLSLDGMGTTLVAAAVTTDGLEWVSVGDSPLYLYRDGRLKRLFDLTEDAAVGVIDFKDGCGRQPALRVAPLRRIDRQSVRRLAAFARSMRPGSPACNVTADEDYAEALRAAVDADWRDDSEDRSIVMISDNPAHADLRGQAIADAERFARRPGARHTVSAVFVDTSMTAGTGYPDAAAFMQRVARAGGGRFVRADENASLSVTILRAILDG